jgi:hypothetical protein
MALGVLDVSFINCVWKVWVNPDILKTQITFFWAWTLKLTVLTVIIKTLFVDLFVSGSRKFCI